MSIRNRKIIYLYRGLFLYSSIRLDSVSHLCLVHSINQNIVYSDCLFACLRSKEAKQIIIVAGVVFSPIFNLNMNSISFSNDMR